MTVVGGEIPLGGVVKVRRTGALEVVEEVRVGAAGEWTVPGLLPGTYAVQLEWRGERHAVEPAVEIGAGADVRLSRWF